MGMQPTVVGDVPPQLAALNLTNINVQDLAASVATARPSNHAVMLDPLTGAVCTLDEIRRMTDDLCAAEEAWLPQFQPCGGLVHSPRVMMPVLAGAAEPAATGPVSSRTPGCGGWYSRW